MKPAYFDLSVENLKEARQFFENIFNWRFEKMSLPFEYYRIQAGDPDEPGIDGWIGELKDLTLGNGKSLSLVTVPVVNLNEAIEKVKKMEAV